MLSEIGHAVAKRNMMTSRTAHAVPISLLDQAVEKFPQHNIISRSTRQHVVKLQHAVAILNTV
jgi:hypothetical protein